MQKCKKISPAPQAEIGPTVEKICSVKRLVVYHLCGGVAIFLGGKGRKVALRGGHFFSRKKYKQVVIFSFQVLEVACLMS